MARKRAVKRNWKPEPLDAMRLAALHWWALTIERTGIEVYASERSRWRDKEVGAILRRAVKELAALRQRPSAMSTVQCQSDADCAEGYICCHGICEPEGGCDSATAGAPNI
jgi:hypothetical protein